MLCSRKASIARVSALSWLRWGNHPFAPGSDHLHLKQHLLVCCFWHYSTWTDPKNLQHANTAFGWCAQETPGELRQIPAKERKSRGSGALCNRAEETISVADHGDDTLSHGHARTARTHWHTRPPTPTQRERESEREKTKQIFKSQKQLGHEDGPAGMARERRLRIHFGSPRGHVQDVRQVGGNESSSKLPTNQASFQAM